MSIFRRREEQSTDGPLEADQPPNGPDAAPTSGDSLKFQLREAEMTISTLEGDLERTRAELVAAQRRSGGTDELAAAIGQPLAHLATQVALVQEGSDALDASDLAVTGRGLLKALASAGIRTEGDVGATTEFDPNRHLPIQGSPATGDRVTLRSPAVAAPSGQIVRYATVEPA